VTIAICHPGKYGDALYSLPLARHLWQSTGQRVAFVTSDYCAKLESLCRAQKWCADFVISKEWVAKDFGCGGQPAVMPVPDAGKYSRIIQCGFTRTPDCFLADWISRDAGYPCGLPLEYDFEGVKVGQRWDQCMPVGYGLLNPFVVLASRGPTTYSDTFREFARRCPLQVVEVGGFGDQVGENSVNATDVDFLVTASIIREARAFVGLMSSQLVLANGFPITRIAPHDGRSWDMRHVMRSPRNHYPINPTVDELIGLLGV
jgi:hypothetical protein